MRLRSLSVTAVLLAMFAGTVLQAAPKVPDNIFVLLKPPALTYSPLAANAATALVKAGASHVEDDGRFTYVIGSSALSAVTLKGVTGLEAVPMPHAFDVDLAGDVADIRTSWPPATASPTLALSDYPAGGPGLYVLKYAFPPKPESLKQLDALGFRRLRYVSWNAYIVAAPAGLPKLAAILPPEVIFIAPVQPYHKIAPSIRGRLDATADPILVDIDPVQAQACLSQTSSRRAAPSRRLAPIVVHSNTAMATRPTTFPGAFRMVSPGPARRTSRSTGRASALPR